PSSGWTWGKSPGAPAWRCRGWRRWSRVPRCPLTRRLGAISARSPFRTVGHAKSPSPGTARPARAQPNSPCRSARRANARHQGIPGADMRRDMLVQLCSTLVVVGLLGLPLVVTRSAVAQVPGGTRDMTVDEIGACALADNPALRATQVDVASARGRL